MVLSIYIKKPFMRESLVPGIECCADIHSEELIVIGLINHNITNKGCNEHVLTTLINVRSLECSRKSPHVTATSTPPSVIR